MSRQHFEALAREVARIPDASARLSAAQAIIRACAPFNPRFDAVRFLRACGI